MSEEEIVITLLELKKNIITVTLPMARRYAHNRCTYAPSIVNEAIDSALAMGIEINPEPDGSMYADDGNFGKWNPAQQRFSKE